LAQILGEEYITEQIQIGVVSNNLQEVTGEEELQPEKATLLGPTKVIPLEYPNITCRSIDIVIPSIGTEQESRVIKQLVMELQRKPSDLVVAYRGKHRWVQRFDPNQFNLVNKNLLPARLRVGGVYLLSGGLQELDLALAEYLVDTVQAKLVLTGQIDLPDRSEWQQWLTTHDEQEATSSKIIKLQALEANGGEILIASARLSDRTEMQKVIAQAKERFGTVHGVIHTAATTGGGLVQLKTPELATPVLAPKVIGTLILADLLKDTTLDLFLLFSSTISITGVFGQVDYCAANAFLDAFASYQLATYGIPTVSINWSIAQWENWSAVSMANATEAQTQFEQIRDRYGITVDEGIEVFRRIISIAEPLPQIIASTQDFQAIIAQQQTSTASSFLELLGNTDTSTSMYSRPELANDYVAPRNEIEQVSAAIWQELFGIEQVGIHDNFFNLGGNSLLAIQIVSQLRKTFQVEISLSKLFESPTVAGIAAVISESIRREQELEEMEQLLREIEGMSLDDVQTQLQELQSGNEENVNG
ncbi:MAG: KR domain-containing protein, partial [Acidobacteriota bacterium]